MLKPKDADTKDKMDEETRTKSDNKRKRISCGFCRQMTLSNKINGNTQPIDDEKLNGKSITDAEAGDVRRYKNNQVYYKAKQSPLHHPSA